MLAAAAQAKCRTDARRATSARRMAAACWPYRDRFITPMAAVAGAVADEILAIMRGAAPLRRVLDQQWRRHRHSILAEGETVTIGLCGDGPRICRDRRHDHASPTADPSRGVATSGWRGRSQSLGIADAVTVLAATPRLPMRPRP